MSSMKKYLLNLFFAFLVISIPQKIHAHSVDIRHFKNSKISHDQALNIGKTIGLGQMTFQKPLPRSSLIAGVYQEFQMVYTVGKTPITKGGHIRIAMRHVFHWSKPQTTSPKKAGFTKITNQPKNVEIELIPWPSRNDGWDLFLESFPWQHSIEIKVVNGTLNPGDRIQLSYGYKNQGSPGALVQPSQETNYVFRTYVAPSKKSTSYPLEKETSYKIIGGNAVKLSLTIPSQAKAGTAFQALIRAEDRYGNQAVSYEKEIIITDAHNHIIWKGRLQSKNQGILPVKLIAPEQIGNMKYSIDDGKLSALSNPIHIYKSEKSSKIFWGDIHGHTLFSDGRETVDHFYRYCRDVAFLNFCAVTDHAYMVSDKAWEESKKITEHFYKQNKFITLQAFEWSGLSEVGGDHNIFFRDKNPPIFRSRSYYDKRNQQAYHGAAPFVNSIEELHQYLEKNYKVGDVFSIPHFGGRAANSKWHNPKVERLVEIFSEHRRSHKWAYDFLNKGYKLGIIGSSDNHTGRPGNGFLKNPFFKKIEINTALVAIIANELSRDVVFDALYNRRTYATTGDRILLDVSMGNTKMGGEIKGEKPPQLHVNVTGTAPIEYIEIYKNGRSVHKVHFSKEDVKFTWQDNATQTNSAAYWVRVMQSNNEEAISSPIWWTLKLH